MRSMVEGRAALSHTRLQFICFRTSRGVRISPLRRFAPPPPLRRGGSCASTCQAERSKAPVPTAGTKGGEGGCAVSAGPASRRAVKQAAPSTPGDPPPFMGEGDHAKHGGGGVPR